MLNTNYKNLVFRGGGILGIAYLGALEVFDKAGLLAGIKRVSGASAGAITALATSFGTSAYEIKAIADTLDFKKVPDKRDGAEGDEERKFAKFIQSAVDEVICIKRLHTDFGWYTTDYFYNWLLETIQFQFEKIGAPAEIQAKKGKQTFADFEAVGFHDLYISVTNVSQHRNEIFSKENHAEFEVALAVRMSMSIPLYFETVTLENGDHYADGGTVNNYPMTVFDNDKYVEDETMFDEKDINWETVGCHLFSTGGDVAPPKKDNLIHYIANLFETLMKVQEIEFYATQNLVDRSAQIYDCGIKATDFNIVVGDDNYQKLYQSGVDGMTEFLAKK